MASRPAPTPSHFSSSVYLGDLSQLFQEIDAIENGPTPSTTTNTNTNIINEDSHHMTTTSSFPTLPSETPTYNEYRPQLTNMIPSAPPQPPQPSSSSSQPQHHPPFLYDNYTTTTPENDLVDPHVGSMQMQYSTLDFSPHLYLYNPENTASMASTQHVPPPQPDPLPSLPTTMTSPTTIQYDDTSIAATTPQYNDTTTYNTQGRSITFATAATSNGYLLQQTDALQAWRSQQASMTSLSRKTSRSSMGGGGGPLSRSNSRSSNGRYQYRSRTSSSSGSAITLYSNSETHQCIVPGCNKTFSRKRDIWRHFFFVHKGMPFMHMGAAIMSGWQFTCEKCGKDYSRKDSLKRHQQKKHPELFGSSSTSSSSSKNKK
ncbi:hypothetical protein O0I10_009018 [Lichtheimia ornata]|uniref:C2H2-type domain-containing protein n=1 Tax=Lichtheimia ornata TaxID=688661 RepID=A0AAD7UX78_9FUNG|nr:uncharacterized protein O0I10_009018 [Lichtheimia ornata]KAJ8655329.1 hypothetical protein O0I10_009018 [Lichtheimia ornata]